MDRTDHRDITIGTLAKMKGAADYIRQIREYGFESYQLTVWRFIEDTDLAHTAKEVNEEIAGTAVVSSIGIYGNPLQDEQTAKDWATMIKAARHFGASSVAGFAGALEDRPIDESMPKFKEVFGPLTKLAEDEGVKIAFENCDMGGSWNAPKWNIAHAPRAWEMMFNEVQSDAIGLEWEPCHQMVSFIDPIPQLRKWVGKVHHIHGKDATVNWDVIKEQGTRANADCVWHRTPGFGDTNWTDVISVLRKAGWTGAIDIEGWHDPVYRDDLEMTGQVASFEYLKRCRGGAYVTNPTP